MSVSKPSSSIAFSRVNTQMVRRPSAKSRDKYCANVASMVSSDTWCS